MFAYIEFFGGIGGEGIGSRQIHNLKRIAFVLEGSFFRIDRYAAVIPDMLVRPGSKVEERRLAAIRISHQSDVDDFPLLEGDVAQFFIRREDVLVYRAVAGGLLFLGIFGGTNHINQLGIAATQGNIVA